jgi:Kef-type K+ transport system membrane component KefB
MVIKQYRARGPVTETLLSVVALDDATALIMYSVAIAIAKALIGESLSPRELILPAVIEIFGALIVGAALGFVYLFPLRFFKKDGNRMSLIVGFIFAGLGLSKMFGFSSLLFCMAMGAIVANFSRDVNKLMDLSDKITPPIFLLFFVASGADLKLSVLPTVGITGAIYIVFRVLGKIFGAWLGGRLCHADSKINRYLGPCLVPQAGVAIGLTLVAAKVVPDYASQIRAVVLAGTLVYELLGPSITKMSLTKAGEIKG